jgi:signal transduction histidine kinase
MAPDHGPATSAPGRSSAADSAAGPPARAPHDGAPVPTWVTIADGGLTRVDERPVRTSRVFVQVGLIAALVIGLVAGLGVIAARRTAEREAVNAAAQVTDLLADAVVQPALRDQLLSSAPAATRTRLDRVVRRQVLGHAVVRVKLWAPDGRIVYSDEPRLVGRRFALGAEESAALSHPATEAEVTDLRRPENRFERGQGKLLEVYRPVWTPSGKPLLFETYTRYTAVTSRTRQLWLGFGGIMLSSLLVLVVLLLPLLWALLDRLRSSQRHRELLLQHAVDASAEERQRIAGTLHDGVVQELVATSFAVAVAADQADASRQPELASRLRAAAGSVRASIGGLRSLLVDIYPPSLRAAGLPAALADLAATVRARGIDVTVDLPDTATPTRLDAENEQLVFRVAQECVRNAVKHAGARTVRIALSADEGRTVLKVADDGAGFDLQAARGAETEGHLGLRLVADLARQAGATLRLAAAPGAGTS